MDTEGFAQPQDGSLDHLNRSSRRDRADRWSVIMFHGVDEGAPGWHSARLERQQKK